MEKWQDPNTIALWIILAVGVLFLLLLFLFLLVRAYFKNVLEAKEAENKARILHQKDLLDTSIKTQEKERKRIAADLHDELIGKLTVLSLEHERGQAEAYKHMIEDSIQTVRRISHDLSPPLIEFSTLDELLMDLFEPWKNKYRITSKIDIRCTLEHSDEVKIQILRVVQELLKNIQKHAEAKELTYHIRQTASGVAFKLTDNGKGFDVQQHASGLGQKNIESRMNFLGGKFRIRSAFQQGTSILLVLKYQNHGKNEIGPR